MKRRDAAVVATSGLAVAGCIGLADFLGAAPTQRSNPAPINLPTISSSPSATSSPRVLLDRDLSFGEVVTPQYGGVVDGTLKIKAQIKYCCSVLDEIAVDFLVNDSLVERRNFTPSDRSGEKVLEFRYIPRRSSRLVVALIIDKQNNVVEDNKDNNRFSREMDIFPNLSAAVNISTISVNPTTPSINRSASVSTEIYYCCNPEHPIEVEFFVDGEKLSTSQFQGQEAGTQSLSFEWIPKVATKSMVTIFADPKDLIRKRFQNFNKATMSINVGS